MKRVILPAVAACAVSVTLCVHAAPPAAPRAFTANVRLSEMKDGTRTVVSQPTLTTEDGSETGFLAGGQMMADLGHGEAIEFGFGVRLTIHAIAPDRLRVLLYASHGEIDPAVAQEPAAARCGRVRESGVHCVRDVAPGEPITVDLDGGRRVEMTVR